MHSKTSAHVHLITNAHGHSKMNALPKNRIVDYHPYNGPPKRAVTAKYTYAFKNKCSCAFKNKCSWAFKNECSS